MKNQNTATSSLTTSAAPISTESNVVDAASENQAEALAEFNAQDKKLLIELLDSIIEEQGLYPIKD